MKGFSKFIAPIVMILAGVIFLIIALYQGQNGLFVIGSFAILVAGVISLLNSMEMVSKKIRTSLTAILVLAALGLGFQNIMVIKKPMDFQKERDRRYVQVVQRLKDIRQVQVEYKNNFGYYCNNFDTLVNFIKNDSIIQVKSIGEVPDTLNEFQALERGIVRRDTVKVPAIDVIFHDKFLEGRADFALLIDSLPYVPFTRGAKFTLNAGEINRGSALVPVFEVVDSKPFDPQNIRMVGSMTEPSTSGNWE